MASKSAVSICSRTRMARATTCADSSAAAAAFGSERALLTANWVDATRKPPVSALTIASSAPASRPSSVSSIAVIEARCRASILAVAIHSHCGVPSILAAAVRN